MTLLETIKRKYTEARTITGDGGPDIFSIRLRIGVQSFSLGTVEDMQSAEWMRDRLAEALERMVGELPPNDPSSPTRPPEASK